MKTGWLVEVDHMFDILGQLTHWGWCPASITWLNLSCPSSAQPQQILLCCGSSLSEQLPQSHRSHSGLVMSLTWRGGNISGPPPGGLTEVEKMTNYDVRSAEEHVPPQCGESLAVRGDSLAWCWWVTVAVVVVGSLILSCDGVLATRLPPQERLSYHTDLPSPPPPPPPPLYHT